MKVKVNTEFERLQLKARDAINFMDSHPAIQNNYFCLQQLLWFSIQTVCKHGYSEHAAKTITIFNKGKDAIRFKKQFADEIAKEDDCLKETPSLVSIEVPYTEYFGEPWEFDHVEYWGELSICICDDKIKSKDKKDRWQLWQGVQSSGRTYEELMINLAKLLKKDYGNFNSESFKTEEEKKNNKEVEAFLFEDIKGKKSYVKMLPNPDYIHVSDEEKNLRWQKWMRENKDKNFIQ